MKLTTTVLPQDPSTETPVKRKKGRPATGRIRNKLLQIRLSDTEHEQLFAFTDKIGTNPTDILRDLLVQLTTIPLPNETVMVKVKGHLLYLTKTQAKQLLVDLTQQL